MKKTQFVKPTRIAKTPEDVKQVDRSSMLTELKNSSAVPTDESLWIESAAKQFEEFYDVPPGIDRCECCRRHISKLKPMTKADNPWIGKFEGARLRKNQRTLAPYDKEVHLTIEASRIFYKAEGFKSQYDWLIHKFGKDEGDEIAGHARAMYETFDYWECKDCLDLCEYEYFAKIARKSIPKKYHLSMNKYLLATCSRGPRNNSQRLFEFKLKFETP
jgi:hypothetical protein